MELQELIRDIDQLEASGDLSADIVSVDYDSRKVKAGSLFVAIRGFVADGNRFIADAVRKGARAIVTDERAVEADVPIVIVPDARKALAIIADRFFGNPQNSLVMTAVTGTNGKTTTAYLTKSIFEAHGVACGLIGTIEHIVGSKRIVSVNTTPESADIHSFLAQMVKAKQSACVMETSSHALELSRVYGIQFRAAAFTNITQDHLDFHGDFKSYLEAKSHLFGSLSGDSTAVINADDPNAGYICDVARDGKILTYGFTESCDIYPVSFGLDFSGSMVELSTPAGTIGFKLSIPGKVNIYNAMAAAGIALSCGLPVDSIVSGLEAVRSIRGRYEIIDEGQDFTVVVDYAHTPDALERVLASVREISKARLISVFGCGGDRDRGKRPLMGEISTRLADYTVITSDNPRTEDPDAIIADILKGIPSSVGANRYKKLTDREKAIREALVAARSGDVVVIAGKGHEDYQIIGTEKIHFDDAESVRRLIKAMKWKATRCNSS